MSRSKLRVNPKMKNHTEFQKLFARWKKQNYLSEEELLKTRNFEVNEFLKPLMLASTNNLSIISACTFYRSLGRRCPSPELVLNSCSEISPHLMEVHVNHTLEQQFHQLPGKIRLEFRRRGIIIIDFHRDPYYGDPNNVYINKKGISKSTNLSYCYLTADIYSPKGKQTIAVIHKAQTDRVEDLFFDILARIECFFQPKLILMDGEFTTARILAALDSRGIQYIGRRTITNRLRSFGLAYSLSDDWDKLRRYHRIIVQDKTKKFETAIYVTFLRKHNKIKALVVSPQLNLSPKEAEKLYDRRFGIESGYRDKHIFQARTTSKNLSVRYILFLFAIILWNLWQTFLMLLTTPKSTSLSCLAQWRRRLRTVRLFLLRDELL